MNKWLVFVGPIKYVDKKLLKKYVIIGSQTRLSCFHVVQKNLEFEPSFCIEVHSVIKSC